MTTAYHILVHGAAEDSPGPKRMWRGRAVATCTLSRPPALLAVTFDDVLDEIAAWPGMFAEPDGSFVWSGPGPARWQIDGCLHDAGPRLSCADLKGDAPAERWREVLVLCAAGEELDSALRLHLIEIDAWVRPEAWLAAVRRSGDQPD